jgi:hypothetical protein
MFKAFRSYRDFADVAIVRVPGSFCLLQFFKAEQRAGFLAVSECTADFTLDVAAVH